jgi:Rhs element Vgr protein
LTGPEALTLTLSSDGTPVGDQYHVISATVRRVMNRIPVAQILLSDGDPAGADFPLSNQDLFAPGRRIEIHAAYHDQDATIFSGVVVRHGIRARRNRGSMLVVECRDPAVKLTVGRKSAVFLKIKDSDLLSKLVSATSGLSVQVDATTTEHEQLVQAYASDWDFLLERAEANGLCVFVEDGTLAIKKPDTSTTPVAQLAFGEDLYEIEAETDAREQFEKVTGASWDPKGQALASAEGSAPSFSAPGNQVPADLAAVAGPNPLALWHGGGLPKAELKDWAGARLLRSRMALVRGRARCAGHAAIKPGVMVELSGVGQRFAGKVFVSGVAHELDSAGWQTDFQFGLPLESTVSGKTVEDRPAAGLVPAIPGLQVGVVMKITEDPANEERIQIKLPLVGDPPDGVWARLASLDAGNQRGWVFRPEVGDEVVVGFLHGDPRCPVVLGMLSSSANPAPLPADDKNNEKGLVTRAEIKLVFDDDKKAVTLQTPGGNKLVVSDDAQGIALEDQNGNKLTMNADGIVVESAGKLGFKAQGDVTLEGASVSLKVQGDAKVEGANVSLKASAQLKGEGSAGTEVSSSAVTTIKGSLVQIN